MNSITEGRRLYQNQILSGKPQIDGLLATLIYLNSETKLQIKPWCGHRQGPRHKCRFKAWGILFSETS